MFLLRYLSIIGLVIGTVAAGVFFSRSLGSNADTGGDVVTSAALKYGDVQPYVSSIYAGDGKLATKAYLDQPSGFDVDSSGAFIIADTRNNVVRRISPYPTRKMFTKAGTGKYGYVDGSKDIAQFAHPEDATVASDGAIYVADNGNNVIRKVKDGTVSTVITPTLFSPKGVLVAGTTLYIANTGAGTILKHNLNNGTTVTAASGISGPTKMIKDGSTMYVVASGERKIKKVNLSNGNVSSVAQGFLDIGGIVKSGEFLFVVDGDGLNDYIRKVTISSGAKEIIASDPEMKTLNSPSGITLYNGKLFVLNRGTSSVWRFDTSGDNPKKIAGKKRYQSEYGERAKGLIGRPQGMTLSANKKWIYFTANNKVHRLKRATRAVSSLVGSVVDNYNKNDIKTYVQGDGRFSDPVGIVAHPNGGKLYVVDRNNNRIRVVDIAAKSVGYLTGAGAINSTGAANNGYQEGGACPNEFATSVNGCAYFHRPTGAVISPDGKYLYVADTGNNMIRRVRTGGVNKGNTKLIAGNLTSGYQNGTKGGARFNAVIDLTINDAGTVLYAADRNNHAIRKIRIKDGKTTTVTGGNGAGYVDGSLSNARWSLPEWIEFREKKLYVSEVGGQHVRLIDLEAKVTKLVAGEGAPGFLNGRKKVAKFHNPKGMVVTKKSVYVADNFNDLIRRIYIGGEAPFTDPAPSLSHVAPGSVKKSDHGATVNVLVEGSNFRHGAEVWFGPHKATVFVNSPDSITAVIPIGSMAEGYYQVKVKNVDTQTTTKTRAFGVAWPDGSVPVVDFWTP